jgi:uncharacterized protein (DUF779 family)
VRVQATPRAVEVVERVRASGREELVVVLGTGCCESTAPFLYDRYYPGADAVGVGEVAGVPVMAPRWLADLYAGDRGLALDLDEGVPTDSFSLETEYGCRLTLRVLSMA